MTQASEPAMAVRARGLVKRYGGVLAVDGLDLDISAGEFFGLLGPNGSGKSSTLHMLSTLVAPSGGSATVAGRDVACDPLGVRAAIGLVFQDSALDRSLSIAQNLRFSGMLHGLRPALIAERSLPLLEIFGLKDKQHQPVASLSGGMRRAVDIVRGLIHHPSVLFLDEPTIGLDLPSRRKIWRFIAELRAKTGMTVLLTTHYLEEADACDRVAFIRKGRLVQAGPPRDLIAGLGPHVIEIETPEPSLVMDRLAPRLGRGLRDGECVQFRYDREDVAELVRIQADLGSLARAMRWRRPNLNDVFLWVAEA
jgi:ABC-2 type transport system ATP-binding protein